MIFPTYRKYNYETDENQVIALLAKTGYRPPHDKVLFAVVATIDSKIVGACFLLANHFVDPLVIDLGLPITTRVRIIDSMLFLIGGTAMFLSIDKLYFAAEMANEGFVNFIQRQFKVKEFTSSTIYEVKL